MSGLQTGVCSQPEDRCASVCVWPGPEPVCMCPSYALDSVRLFPVVGVVSDGVAGRGSCGPGFVREARESVGVSRSGHGLLAHGAPWLRRWASAAGSGGPLTRPFQSWNSLGACS